ncbi:MAG: hypothetical protein G01um1014106_564 [Parcubacteria group bacterium Gr01-1014_106]|nr:MAG: hypothetical protein G01um1014106_564 [Parcubacteria group bacterium Gr01-1014_106]
MQRDAFERLMMEAVTRIPQPFRAYLQDIALVIEAEPTRAQKDAAGLADDEELFGLYEGVPRTERAYLSYRLPDKISLFQGPLERACGDDADALTEEVAHTVWHELAHALGFQEERIAELEAERGWT